MGINVQKIDPFTGKSNTWYELPITQKQLDNWNNGTLIQNAMPNLTPDQREFLMTGITPESWDKNINFFED